MTDEKDKGNALPSDDEAPRAPAPQDDTQEPGEPAPEPDEQPGAQAQEGQPQPAAEADAEPEPRPEPDLDEAETGEEEAPESEAPPQGAEEAPPEAAADEEAETEDREEPEPEPEPERAASPPPECYDGLETGLAWFGAEPFEPPVPAGYRPPPAGEAPGEAEAVLQERRQRVRARIAARRQETDAQKKWYQRIPVGALSMLPIVLVLAGLMIFYPPWGGLPGPKQPLDEKLLAMGAVADQSAALAGMGVREAFPRCWQVLPGNVLLMDSPRAMAKLVFDIPPGMARFEVSCEVCLLQTEREFGVWLKLDDPTAVGITSQEHKRDMHRIRGRMKQGALDVETRYEYQLKPRQWYELKIRVGADSARYLFNGKALKASVPRPGNVSAATLSMFNVRLIVRNWKVEATK